MPFALSRIQWYKSMPYTTTTEMHVWQKDFAWQGVGGASTLGHFHSL